MTRKRLPVFREHIAEEDLTAHVLYLLAKRPSAAARFPNDRNHGPRSNDTA